MLFPPDFLTRVEYLSIMSKRVFRGSLLAQRRTMQMGSGIEFSDHREFANGDDLRYLDWNVYARYGDLLIKRFQEERDLHVYFLVDCSQSMAYGSPAKFDLARQMAAALAYVALADLDRISILGYADRIMKELPVTRGKNQILSIMRFLEGLETGGEDTNVGRGVQDFLVRGPRSGLVVVLSDLFDPHGYQKGLDQLRYRRFDAHVIQLHDPQEANPQMLGDVEFVDIETQSARKVTVTEKNLRTYKRLFDEHQASVRTYCKNYGWGCTQSPTNVPFDDLIIHMMRSSAVAARA